MADDRMTPSQVAKEPGTPPYTVSLLYGAIKRGTIKSFPNPGGRGQLVSKAEALSYLANRRVKGPKGAPRPAGSSRRALKRGQIISYGDRKTKVAAAVREEGGEGSLIWTHDGRKDQFWQNDRLIERIRKGNVNIESPNAVLAVLVFHYEQENPELARSLKDWALAQGIEISTAEGKLEAVEQLPEEEAQVE